MAGYFGCYWLFWISIYSNDVSHMIYIYVINRARPNTTRESLGLTLDTLFVLINGGCQEHVFWWLSFFLAYVSSIWIMYEYTHTHQHVLCVCLCMCVRIVLYVGTYNIFSIILIILIHHLDSANILGVSSN